MLIKYVYIVFLGIILATFVGVGIAAFYKGPTPPDYPTELQYYDPIKLPEDSTISAQRIEKQIKHDAQFKEFQKLNEEYSKNVSIISLAFAVLMLAVSLNFAKKIPTIADGLLLGGVLTLGYSVVRGFSSNDDIYRFLVVGAGVIIAMILGYIKFVAPIPPNKKK